MSFLNRCADCVFTLAAALLALSLGHGLLAADPPKVHLAGDSTLADKPVDPPNPEHGWGQSFPRYFREPAMIVNHAQNGRSTKSFIAEGRWQTLVDALRPGDWAIIQFGHNDQKVEDPTRYAGPDGGFRENLRRFVHEVRAKGRSRSSLHRWPGVVGAKTANNSSKPTAPTRMPCEPSPQNSPSRCWNSTG